MKGTMSRRQFLNYALLLSSLAILPGCKPWDWIKEKTCKTCPMHDEAVETQSLKSDMDAVVSVKGKTVVNVEEFKQMIEQLKQVEPNFKQLFESFGPDYQCQLLQQLADSLAIGQSVLAFAKDSGLDKDADYQKTLKRVVEQAEIDIALRALNNKIFNDIKIADDEAKSYMQANKDKFNMPPFVKTMGGVKAQSVEAKNEDEAKKIKERLEKNGSDIVKVVQDFRKKVEELGVVSPQSMTDRAIKTAVLGMKNVPGVDIVKSGDKYFVVRAVSKVEPEFEAFDKVKEDAKKLIAQEKFFEMQPQKLEEIKQKYAVTVNKDLLQKMCNVSSAPKAAQENAAASQPAKAA